jgi:hypothetical protein
LTEERTQALAPLDRAAAMRRIIAGIPSIAGVDVAFGGAPDGDDRMVLGYSVNTRTDVVDGLVVPRGQGLGGQVMLRCRPLWFATTAETRTSPISSIRKPKPKASGA